MSNKLDIYVFITLSVYIYHPCLISRYRIGGVIVSVLVSSAVDRGFEPRSDQTKDYTIGSCCFSANHATLMRKCKDWLALKQYNVSEWADISIREKLFQ